LIRNKVIIFQMKPTIKGCFRALLLIIELLSFQLIIWLMSPIENFEQCQAPKFHHQHDGTSNFFIPPVAPCTIETNQPFIQNFYKPLKKSKTPIVSSRCFNKSNFSKLIYNWMHFFSGCGSFAFWHLIGAVEKTRKKEEWRRRKRDT
jgi:hypothetical protein